MDNHLATETVLTVHCECAPLKKAQKRSPDPMPVYKDFVPLSCPTEKISECFTKACKASKFKLNFESTHKIIAFSTPAFSISQYFRCFTGKDPESITQIEFQVKIMAFPNQKLIIVQGLQGCKTKQAVLINQFKVELGKILLNRELYFNDQPTMQRINSEVWGFFATAAGRNAINDLATKLQIKFELRLIKLSVVQIINHSYSHYPTSVKSEYLKAFELVVFAKFSQEILKFYQEHSEENREQFEIHLKKLVGMENQELFKRLMFKEKFKLVNESEPYKEPVKLLRELGRKKVPIEKLNALHDVHVAIRTTVLEYWKGKEELESMDDILPVYIFVIIRANLADLPLDVLMLQDYLRVSQDMESEERLVVNYHVAIQYIVNECFY